MRWLAGGEGDGLARVAVYALPVTRGEESGDVGEEGLLCIMFTDLVGWTELGIRVGDDAADRHRRSHFAAVRAALAAHRGREVKTIGDSVLATFRSALDASRCALEIQRSASDEVRVRIGIHAGEPIRDENDLFGTAVNVASRLCTAAGPGEILISDLTRSLIAGRGDLTFEPTEPLRLKGVGEAVAAHHIRDGTRPRLAVSSPTSTLQTGAPFRPASPILCPVLIGRSRERERMVARLDAAIEGHGSVVGAIGDAGAGKSRLCQALVDTARDRGLVVLAGRAVPTDSPVPYRPLIEAFGAAFRSSPLVETPELAGFEGHIRRLVPGYKSTEASSGADESPVLLGEAVVRMLRTIGGTDGCVLLLEDLHWTDIETLAVVDYLADALQDERVLVVLNARPAGATNELLSRLQRRDPSALIDVTPLDDHDVARVVGACLATDDPPLDVVAFIAAHSEGNPFLIEELLAGLVASGALTTDGASWASSDLLRPTVPFSFADSIRRRLATLDERARRVLDAAAVLGRRFEWELLPGIADVDAATVVAGLRRGVDEQLIEVDGNDFRFRHALTREAVLAELLPPVRRALARRALPAVEQAHPDLPAEWCQSAAELAEAAGDQDQAAAHLVVSARRALSVTALASAETTAYRALRLAEDDRIVDDADEVLVEVLTQAGKPRPATTIGAALVERLEAKQASADRIAALLIVLARAAIAAGEPSAAAVHAERARALLDAGAMSEAMAARVEAIAAHVALEQARLDEATALATSAIDRAAATGQVEVECEALEVMGRVTQARSVDESKVWFQRGVKLAEEHGLAGWLLRAKRELAAQDMPAGGMASLLETRELASQHGALVTVAYMDLAFADFALAAFDRDACFAAAKRCVDASRRYGLAALPVAELWLAGAHALACDRDGMEAAAARALERDPDDPRILGDLWGRVRATHAIVHDDRARLRECLDQQMVHARVTPVTTSIFPHRIMWAMVHAIDDDDFGAAALAELLTATNLKALFPYFDESVEQIVAIGEARAGDVDVATARFDAAWRRLQTLPVAFGPIQFGNLLAAEAAVRDGWGDPAAWARAAAVFFGDMGYDAVTQACRAVLAETGAPLSRARTGESDVPAALRAFGVTQREFEVLRLVAEELTNRQIGERLYLSPRTVERHLASLFDRTGVRGRAELAIFFRSKLGSPSAIIE